MLNDKELYNIVVVGAMNPRIHVPSWYSQFDLISKEEYDAAIVAASTLATAQFSQFQFAGITVLCLPDRWEIKTTKRSDLDRMKAITQKIFDELLMHTPVMLMGFNFIWQKATNVANVARHLASRLVEMPFGLADVAPDSGEFSIRRVSENRLNAITVAPSPLPDSSSYVNISINYEYKFAAEGPFKLEDTAFARYAADQKEADQQALLIVKALNESSE